MFSTAAVVGLKKDAETICRFFIQGLSKPAYKFNGTGEALDFIEQACREISPIDTGLISNGSEDIWNVSLLSFHLVKGKAILRFISDGKPLSPDYFISTKASRIIRPDEPIAYAIATKDMLSETPSRTITVTSGRIFRPDITTAQEELDSYRENIKKPGLFSKLEDDSKFYAVDLYDPEWLEQ